MSIITTGNSSYDLLVNPSELNVLVEYVEVLMKNELKRIQEFVCPECIKEAVQRYNISLLLLNRLYEEMLQRYGTVIINEEDIQILLEAISKIEIDKINICKSSEIINDLMKKIISLK